MLIKLTEQDLKEGMVNAYKIIAIKAGMEVNEKTKFKVDKIEIAENIENYFINYYLEKIEPKENLTENQKIAKVFELMLMKGAKTNKNLKDYEVLVKTGFVDNGKYEPTNKLRR